jgi:mannose-6-phosphate isomerase-like protein (cupin superfamily)
MLSLVNKIPTQEHSFGNVEYKNLLKTDQQIIGRVQIASGNCFEARQQEGREETVTVIKGNGWLEIGDQSKKISADTLVKLTAEKVCRIYNDSQEALELCFVSTPSNNQSKEVYLRHKNDRDDVIKTGNGERIYELFGVGNGSALSHSVALVEIEPGGGSDPHIHPIVEESYVIIDGIAKLTIGQEISDRQAGEVILIPVGQRHQISNIGNGKGILRFLAVVTPPWTKDCGIYGV